MIPIFLASDEKFVKYMAVTIESIVSGTEEAVEFYVLDGGITKSSKQRITNMLDHSKHKIEFLNIDMKYFKNFPVKRHFSINTYFRYLIPVLKPEFKKVLYVDTDMIVNGFLGGQIYRELNQKLSILRNDKDKCWTSVVNKIFSKNLINTMENHKNPPNLSVGEDCLWMIKAAFFANKIATVDDSTYFYRYNPTSLTHIVNDKMLKDKDITTKEIIKFMNEFEFDKTSVETVIDNCIWHNLFDKSKTLDYLKLSIYSKYYEKSIFNLKYLGKFLKCNIQFFKYKLTFNKNRKKYKEKYLILKNQLKNFYE